MNKQIEAAVNLITPIRKAIKSRSYIGMFEEAPLSVALGMAIAALEKQEKYAWHDLWKDPEDLPEIGLYVDARMISCETGKVIPRYACLWKFCNQMMWKDVRHGGYEYKACVAWRYIEPFEEDNE